MRKTPERTYRCRVRPCQRVKGDANHWFVATIDIHGRLSFDKFTSSQEFEKAAARHGALEICSEACMHTHMSRWASGGITSAERPGNASPAVLDESKGELTCWVSDVYKSSATFNSVTSPTRIVNFRDEGQKLSMWCFRPDIFYLVELTAGGYAKFKVRKKGDYVNVVGVLEINGKPIHPSLTAKSAEAAKPLHGAESK